MSCDEYMGYCRRGCSRWLRCTSVLLHLLYFMSGSLMIDDGSYWVLRKRSILGSYLLSKILINAPFDEDFAETFCELFHYSTRG